MHCARPVFFLRAFWWHFESLIKLMVKKSHMKEHANAVETYEADNIEFSCDEMNDISKKMKKEHVKAVELKM